MTFATWTTSVVGVISSILVPLVIALSALAFLWGVFKYFFLHGDEEEKRAEGRQFIIWGLLGLVVIFSVWQLVNILLSTLGIAPGTS